MQTVAPRRPSLLSCVVAAVLSLTFAGFAHAFTVQIVQPADDPWLMATDTPQCSRSAGALARTAGGYAGLRYGCDLSRWEMH